jgi:hypothetical protein
MRVLLSELQAASVPQAHMPSLLKTSNRLKTSELLTRKMFSTTLAFCVAETIDPVCLEKRDHT